MKKILLVLEDYTELVFTETLLKKIGFSVETSRTEVSLGEKLMSFVPDLILATGSGSKIEAARVSKKIRKRRGLPRLIALYARGTVPSTEQLTIAEIDAALEVPASPRTLIAAICQVSQLDLQATLAKFEKLPIAKDSEPVEKKSQYVKGHQKAEPEMIDSKNDDLQIVRGEREKSDHNRVTGEVNIDTKAESEVDPQAEAQTRAMGALSSAERMKRVLEKENDPALGGLPHQAVINEVKEIRDFEKANREEISEIDAARKEFVKKLLSSD